MDYAALRKLHCAGMIYGTTNTLAPMAVAIRKREAGPGKMFSPYVSSHIAVGGFLRNGEPCLYEMTAPLGRIIPLSEYEHGKMGDHFVFAALPDAQDKLQSIQIHVNDWLRRNYRRRYDWPGLFEFLGFGNDDSKKRYCSELSRDMMKEMAWPYPPEWNDGVSPWDQQRHFEASGKVVWRAYKRWPI